MRRLGWLWPAVTNKDEAKSAANRAAGAVLFVTACTGGLAILSLVKGRPYAGIDGDGLVDAGLFGLIAWRLFKYSFPWAIFGLILMAAEVFWMLSNSASHVGIITVLIMLALVAGVRGTYYLRQEKRRALSDLATARQTDNSPIEPI